MKTYDGVTDLIPQDLSFGGVSFLNLPHKPIVLYV
jgi:hypothetical protein